MSLAVLSSADFTPPRQKTFIFTIAQRVNVDDANVSITAVEETLVSLTARRHHDQPNADGANKSHAAEEETEGVARRSLRLDQSRPHHPPAGQDGGGMAAASVVRATLPRGGGGLAAAASSSLPRRLPESEGGGGPSGRYGRPNEWGGVGGAGESGPPGWDSSPGLEGGGSGSWGRRVGKAAVLVTFRVFAPSNAQLLRIQGSLSALIKRKGALAEALKSQKWELEQVEMLQDATAYTPDGSVLVPPPPDQAGTIVGGVLGGLSGAMLLAGGGLFWLRARRRARVRNQENTEMLRAIGLEDFADGEEVEDLALLPWSAEKLLDTEMHKDDSL